MTIVRATAIFLLALTGCEVDESSQCFRIFGASATPDALIPPAVQAAVAVIGISPEPDMPFDALCSGTLIAPDILLTAAHCTAPLENLTVGFASSIDAIQPACNTVTVEEVVEHPTWDVAIFKLRPTALEVQPLPLAAASLTPGTAVVLGGFGLDEQSEFGARRFAASRVLRHEEELTFVGVPEDIGACLGDSGGPMLWSEGGQWHLAGALTTGEASCVGIDAYVASSSILPWLRAS